MGEEDAVTEAVEASVNGVCRPEETDKIVTEKKEVEENGVKGMEEDQKESGVKDVEEDKKEVRDMEEDKKENEKGETRKTDEENKFKEEKGKEEEEEKEAVKADEEKDSVEEESEKVQEKTEASNDEEDKKPESKEEKEPKKRSRRKSSWGKTETEKREVAEKNVKEPVTPTVFSLDRPVRERKSVERLVAVIEKEPAKWLRIEKGRGTALKDIPNVAYKLKKKKTDETFKMLHAVLFGRKGKEFKNNLSQFSGFAWHENEEKQKLKIKEKLDKYVKEKLLEFCDVLDIRVAKATTRKEEIVAELLDFLAAPHAITDVLLAENQQSSKGTKRGRASPTIASRSGGTTAKRSPRKRRKTDDTAKDKEKSSHEPEDESEKEDKEDKENENGGPDASEDEVAEHSKSEDKGDESEEHKQGSLKSLAKKEDSEKTVSKKTATPKKDIAVSSPRKTSRKSSSKSSKVVSSDTSPMVSSRKKKEVETAKRKRITPSKSATKEKASKEKAGKKVVKGKSKSKDPNPSDDELSNVITDILKEVDFNTATFTDILKELARRYEVDLTPRKAAIKLLIQAELTKLAEEEDDDEDESEPEKEDGGEKPARQEVKT